jgi:hypothetical protein
MTTIAPSILDVHGLLVRALRADPGVSGIVGQKVYARKYNERQQMPACRVVFPATTSASIPAPAWWDYDGQVDCHADTHQQALALASQVQRALLALTGTSHPEGWIANVDAWSVQSGFDEEWTPPKPRWIVAATITARTRQED